MKQGRFCSYAAALILAGAGVASARSAGPGVSVTDEGQCALLTATDTKSGVQALSANLRYFAGASMLAAFTSGGEMMVSSNDRERPQILPTKRYAPEIPR